MIPRDSDAILAPQSGTNSASARRSAAQRFRRQKLASCWFQLCPGVRQCYCFNGEVSSVKSLSTLKECGWNARSGLVSFAAGSKKVLATQPSQTSY